MPAGAREECNELVWARRATHRAAAAQQASAAPERESHHSAGGLDCNATQARGVTTPR